MLSLVETFIDMKLVMKNNNETFIQKIYRHIAVAVSVIIGLFTVLFCVKRRANKNRKLDNNSRTDDNRIRHSVENCQRAIAEARKTIEKIKRNKQSSNNS